MTAARGALAALALVAVAPFPASATGPITCSQPFAALCAPVTYACRTVGCPTATPTAASAATCSQLAQPACAAVTAVCFKLHDLLDPVQCASTD